MKNLGIGRRLTAAFIVVILGMLTVAGAAIFRVQDINASLTTINDLNSVKQRYAINFRGSVHDRAIALRDVVLASTPAQAGPEVELIRSLEADYDESAAWMDEVFANPTNVSAAEQDALAEIQRIEAETNPLVQEVIDLHAAGNYDRALDVLTAQAKPLFVDWLAAINVFIDMQEEMNSVETAQARTITGSFTLNMLLLCGVAVAVAAVLGIWTTRGITRPLAQTVQVLESVANGDLTRRLEVRSRDEVGKLAASVNSTLDGLREVLEGIAERAEGLSETSSEVGTLSSTIGEESLQAASVADDSAKTAREVSQNVGSVADGSAQMGQAIGEIARSASDAAAVASRAVAVAEGATGTIAQLGESSRLIGDIVKTITTIAEQTNLLALNATIEAARAGDAGKGFAVVAGEVKDLAQATARATEDIAHRVDAIQADSASAVTSITEVSHVIEQMSSHQTAIAGAVEEQSATTAEMNRGVADASAGTHQIAESIDGVADVARRSSESMEQFHAAAEDLSRVSGELKVLISRFEF